MESADRPSPPARTPPSTPNPASSRMLGCPGLIRVWDALLCTTSTIPPIACSFSYIRSPHSPSASPLAMYGLETHARQVLVPLAAGITPNADATEDRAI